MAHVSGATNGGWMPSRLIARSTITDPGEVMVEIDIPFVMVTRRIRKDGDERGMIVYGYKLRPVLR